MQNTNYRQVEEMRRPITWPGSYIKETRLVLKKNKDTEI